jgi:DNA mismatch repair protein MutL
MSKKIHVLPEEVAQSIAAGEVVERPASVVKELMENAIDAGSSEITVELRRGGLELIRVCDNGEGIDREDVPLALKRYATSKIERADDLFSIRTLGFRGEALPSIASVSRTSIKTRVPHALSGTWALCEGGEIRGVSEIGCPVGTEVDVQELFYNVPVKRKFLRSIRSELRASLGLFLRLSLSHPAISFKFLHDGRMLHEHPRTESHLVRIEAVLGKEIAGQLRRCEFDDGEIRILAFTSVASFSKGNPDGIHLFLNGRFIKDRMIHKAILQAYRNVIPAERFPVTVLFLSLPPFRVDVNVHPTKSEVKFRDPERIFETIPGTLRSVHEQRMTGSEGGPERRGTPEYHPRDCTEASALLPMVRESSAPEWRAGGSVPYRILGQVQETYILCEGDEGLIIIDQHAAHERLLFKKYREQYETETIPSERFLLPILMELSVEESLVLTSHLEIFRSLGFEIDPIGERTYAVRSRPSFVDAKDSGPLVRELLDELSSFGREGRGSGTLEAVLVRLACHSAVRGNFVLKREEMEALLADLRPFDLSTTCPHGRPVFFVLHRDELAKRFRRK